MTQRSYKRPYGWDGCRTSETRKIGPWVGLSTSAVVPSVKVGPERNQTGGSDQRGSPGLRSPESYHGGGRRSGRNEGVSIPDSSPGPYTKWTDGRTTRVKRETTQKTFPDLLESRVPEPTQSSPPCGSFSLSRSSRVSRLAPSLLLSGSNTLFCIKKSWTLPVRES